ncbi:hypothetical protein [Microbacterium lacus]|uniref:hypothetical protein n=1 Tax=Microbacterium lacus TaxID=415217 RepID=UPI000C2BBB48|nr:hypothetical protein [Microbacterium lacus]
MSLATILPDQAFVPLVTPLDPYHDAFWDVESEPELGLTPRTRMLALPAIALATLELQATPAKSWRPTTRGLVTEASIRAAIWKDRGLNLSAYEMALNFQSLFFGGDGRRGGNVPLLGLDLLRCIDELSMCSTELWCSTPTVEDPFEFEQVRLGTALARIANVEGRLSRLRKRR